MLPTKVKLKVLAIVVLLTCALILGLWWQYTQRSQTTASLLYYRVPFNTTHASEPLPPTMLLHEELVLRLGIRHTAVASRAHVMLFQSLNQIDQTLASMNWGPQPPKYIFALLGSDTLANKALLFTTLASKLDPTVLDAIVPKTYVVTDERGLADLKADWCPETIYILKKNVQRQQGNTLVRGDLTQLMESGKQGYVVCQKLLQDPFLIAGRKVNLRVYLLIIVRAGTRRRCEWYIYNDGFLYYTPQAFVKGSMEPDANITTGYIDRRVYEENPMTHKDLRVHLGHKKYAVLHHNIVALMTHVYNAYHDNIGQLNASLPGVKFTIFGCDIAPDAQLNVRLMEVNKGPDLNAKDARDRKVKQGLLRGTLQLAGLAHAGGGNMWSSVITDTFTEILPN